MRLFRNITLCCIFDTKSSFAIGGGTDETSDARDEEVPRVPSLRLRTAERTAVMVSRYLSGGIL